MKVTMTMDFEDRDQLGELEDWLDDHSIPAVFHDNCPGVDK
jgi:hypothetical protein